jgi:bis(5'-nucleosidyl)-tetraphosphatase
MPNVKPTTLSVGVVPVLFRKELKKPPLYLLLRVYGYWDFPKGMTESNENPKKTALRELAEETGIEKTSFPWGDIFIETEPYSRGKVARYYLAEVFSPDVQLLKNPVTGQIEHHEFRWCSYAEACDLLNDRVMRILDWAHEKVKKTDNPVLESP